MRLAVLADTEGSLARRGEEVLEVSCAEVGFDPREGAVRIGVVGECRGTRKVGEESAVVN